MRFINGLAFDTLDFFLPNGFDKARFCIGGTSDPMNSLDLFQRKTIFFHHCSNLTFRECLTITPISVALSTL